MRDARHLSTPKTNCHRFRLPRNLPRSLCNNEHLSNKERNKTLHYDVETNSRLHLLRQWWTGLGRHYCWYYFMATFPESSDSKSRQGRGTCFRFNLVILSRQLFILLGLKFRAERKSRNGRPCFINSAGFCVRWRCNCSADIWSAVEKVIPMEINNSGGLRSTDPKRSRDFYKSTRQSRN